MQTSLALAIVSSLTFMLIGQLPIIHAAETNNSDQLFDKLSDQFINEELAQSPVYASEAGYHSHPDPKTGEPIELDALLDDFSLKNFSNRRKFYSNWREKFKNSVDKGSLSIQNQADWQLLLDQINLKLLDLENIQSFKYNPTVVVELIGNAIFTPLTTNYAPDKVRFNHVLSRIKQIPRLLKQAQTHLKSSDHIYVSTAIEENKGNMELIEKTVKQSIKNDASLMERYQQVAPKALTALKSFSNFLENDLAEKPAKRSWRLGKELYDQKFKLLMQTNIKPDELLNDARRELLFVRSKMMQLAVPMHMEFFPERNHRGVRGKDRENLVIGEVLQKISDNHVKRGELIGSIKKDLASITQFIKDKKIVSLSSRDNLKVVATPKFLRGVYSVAGFHSAPPLEPNTRAEYWVTPIGNEMSDEKAESKLREYNNYTLKWLTIHEALPGHYIQFEHLNNIEPKRRRLLRSLYANGAYVEGWAEYIAQVMLDEGFMQGSREFQMTMHKIRLRLLANAILDIEMHTGKMSDKEALDLMTKDAFQTKAEAEGKLRRAKLTSCQLPTYYVGLREWLAFRERYQQKVGKDFELIKFHNKVLEQGPLAIQYVEKLVTTTN